MQTLYLETQVIAREAGPEFALRLDAATLAAALDAGVAAGDTVAVVDAAQDYFACRVVKADAEGICVRIAAREGRPARPAVHLVQGVSNDEAMDTIIRQVSELGVAGVLPVRFARSPFLEEGRADALQARWQHLAAYSARQAGLAKVPDVGFSEPLADACETLSGFDAVVVCWEGEASRSMAQAVSELGIAAGEEVALVVGPRGGIADDEMALLRASNPRLATVGLGPAILRVETAGLVAPALLISALGGLR